MGVRPSLGGPHLLRSLRQTGVHLHNHHPRGQCGHTQRQSPCLLTVPTSHRRMHLQNYHPRGQCGHTQTAGLSPGQPQEFPATDIRSILPPSTAADSFYNPEARDHQRKTLGAPIPHLNRSNTAAMKYLRVWFDEAWGWKTQRAAYSVQPTGTSSYARGPVATHEDQ